MRPVIFATALLLFAQPVSAQSSACRALDDLFNTWRDAMLAASDDWLEISDRANQARQVPGAFSDADEIINVSSDILGRQREAYETSLRILDRSGCYVE